MVYESAYIVYYVVAAISALCSIYVASTLCIVGSLKTSATKLLLLLHVTLLAEELTSIPHIFNDNRGLCSFIAFFHFYSGLANAAAIGLLVVSYRYHFLEDTWEVMSFIDKYSRYMVGVFPLITLLPFITNSYSNDNQIWCTMETDSHVTNVWAFTVFYGWAWLILDISIAVLIHTMYVVYSVDREFGRKLFSTTGLYAIISLLAWIPRTAARFSNFGGKLDNTAFLYAYFPVYIAGICYTVVFLQEKNALLLFDRLSDWTGDSASLDGAGGDPSFSWEEKSDVIVRSRANSLSSEPRVSARRGAYTPLIVPEKYRTEVDFVP